ncbi:MAG: DUF2752 domain-containing protein [Deltaproteobacteria bacterium]|nr:DUF2752 domain-containing protein [Deltaproteobacteria bacterium]
MSHTGDDVTIRIKRLLWCGAGIFCAWLLVSRLTPSPTGIGTHEQFGLPPCPLHWLTGWPCPACGLTTSWCHLSHGAWAAAFRAHLLGPLVPIGLAGWAAFNVPSAQWAWAGGLSIGLASWLISIMRLSGLF